MSIKDTPQDMGSGCQVKKHGALKIVVVGKRHGNPGFLSTYNGRDCFTSFAMTVSPLSVTSSNIQLAKRPHFLL